MRRLYFIFTVIALFSCNTDDKEFVGEISKAKHLHAAMDEYTNIIVHDIFSPPQASRNYVYPSIAVYETLIKDIDSLASYSGQLNEMPEIPAPNAEIYKELAALQAFYTTAKNFIFSEEKILELQDSQLNKLKKLSHDKTKWNNSIDYGNQVAKTIIEWSNQDNYKESRSFPKFTITDDVARWKPTPPAYMEGIEPSWKLIRTMVLDSAAQFKPAPPTSFSMDKNSKFYKEVLEVYDAVKKADNEKTEIASFWDCNPYVMNLTGHVMYATKKITPGGHWMGIAGIASKASNDKLVQTAKTYSLVSIGLFDGFISCWDEKYRSNLVRPETVINEFIDEKWIPLLQTPPFPEHTSGHSVISTAAATILTDIYGDNFQFDDSVELQYGLPVRSFSSFNAAANEAAISRLYGGIHYMPAISYGQTQGRAVGNLINERITL